MYSWERPERGSRRRKRKPFYQRWWFYVPIGLVVLGILGGGLGFEIIRSIYDGKAEKFDLKDLSRMESASVIYDRNGVEFGKIFLQNRTTVPLSKISPMMVKAVIAAEDNDFYKHDGVDYKGMLRAALSNWKKGRISQGASTVTQQLARNTFDLKERSYQRKLVEVFLAKRIEREISKDDIMEMYLNRVYFGSGLYGVEAAARGYFGKSAAELNAGQCAMLAGLLKNPGKFSPWNNITAATETRNFVLKRMREMGFLTREEASQFSGDRLYVLKRTNPFRTSYAVDYIRQQVIASLGFEQANNGGFKIYTTLDQGVQRAAERALKERLTQAETRPDYQHETYATYHNIVRPLEERFNQGYMDVKMPAPKYLQGAVLALENSTGGILAMVGGRDIKHSEYNRVIQARRPSGTAFAPFVFAAAYDNGIFPGEIIQDACLDNRYVMVGGATGILGEWGVEREENEYEGAMTTREVLAKGKNAATVRLGLQTGIKKVNEVARKAGIVSPLKDYSNTFLGSSEVTLDELTFAYTIFPNHGSRPKQTYVIQKIIDSDGAAIFQASPEKVAVIKPEAADQVSAGLADALHLGTGSLAYTDYGLGAFPAAGKTGTSYNFMDSYFIGYTTAITCGVWVGFDRPTKIYRGAFGNDLALPIWVKTMNAAAERYVPQQFAVSKELKDVEICRSSGLLATEKCVRDDGTPYTYHELATEEEMPHVRCDVHGGGVRDYAKTYEEKEWPRAIAAIDLASIRPIAVMGPALLGFSDVYNSVRPAGHRLDDSTIPVAKAIPVNGEAPTADAAAEPGSLNVDAAVAAAVRASEPEVRKAEAVRPMDSPLDASTVPVAPPAPINF